MAYSYKFIPAGMPINGNNPKTDYSNLFQATLNDQFYNSTTWWNILEEDTFSSGVYNPVDVRINHVIDARTGEKKGDDYKLILFKDLGHATGLGFRYFFADNYWLVENSEIIKNIAASCTVVRCNNTLRWQDESGAIYSEPCAIKLEISRNKNLVTIAGVTPEPEGLIQIETQFNSNTNKIKPNQRFLLGNTNNWVGYKVVAGGLLNFNNLKTLDNLSAGILHLTLDRDYEHNIADDYTNGIAAVNGNVYVLSLNQTSVSGGIGQQIQLIPNITLNGETVSRNVTWVSSDATKATVDANGLVTMVALGSAVITCSLQGNSNVYSTCTALVVGSTTNTYEVRISPSTNFILQGESITYTAYLYLNGVQQGNVVSFSDITSGVPQANYLFSVISSNSFTVKNNLLFLTAPVTIQCTSGAYSNTISISLRGEF